MLSVELTQALDAESGLACALDAEGTIVYLHERWDTVLPPGAPNAARSEQLIGSRWLDAMTDDTVLYYERLVASVFSLPSTIGAGLVHVSQCNTPDLVRQCTARFAPVFDGDGPPIGATIVYGLKSLGTAAQHYGMSLRPVETFTNDDGNVVQCSCCRRLRDPQGRDWEFVPAALAEAPARLSHGLCPTCVALYYPDL
ncbi:MAG: hypothetical protein ABIP13_00390 [Tepidiformaceae bacterium]